MKNHEMTSELLTKLCKEAEAGDAEAAFEVAEYYYRRREFTSAFEWYLKTARCENPNPMVYFNIGYAYQNGEGTEVDLLSAYDYYEKAAVRHLPQALYNLAYFYYNGLVVKQSFDKAEEYSRQALRELDELVTRLHKAEVREEKTMQNYLEILQSLEKTSSEWRAIANENAYIREQLAEAKAKESILEGRIAECKSTITQLKAENQSMAELLIKAQQELHRKKKQ